jgi:hypothetical protein
MRFFQQKSVFLQKPETSSEMHRPAFKSQCTPFSGKRIYFKIPHLPCP